MRWRWRIFLRWHLLYYKLYYQCHSVRFHISKSLAIDITVPDILETRSSSCQWRRYFNPSQFLPKFLALTGQKPKVMITPQSVWSTTPQPHTGVSSWHCPPLWGGFWKVTPENGQKSGEGRLRPAWDEPGSKFVRKEEKISSSQSSIESNCSAGFSFRLLCSCIWSAAAGYLGTSSFAEVLTPLPFRSWD